MEKSQEDCDEGDGERQVGESKGRLSVETRNY